MRNVMVMMALLALSACVKPTPIPPSAMLPADAVYDQTSRNFYLKHQLEVGEFAYGGNEKETGAITFSEFDAAVRMALRKGNYLAPAGKARYALSGTIKDVATPMCIFGSCESGATVEYTLTNTKTHTTVFNELLVVPYTMECPFFINDPTPIIMKAMTETLGTNIAHLIQTLNRKSASDLE